jgi:uridine phosphorylase
MIPRRAVESVYPQDTPRSADPVAEARVVRPHLCISAEDIFTVEMEASCLFAVAKATGTAAAAAFVVSDVLHGEQWEPHFGAADVLRGLWALFEAAETCLSQ